MRALLLIGLVVAASVIAGCGESKSEKAQTQVCDARAEISKQVDELKGLTPTAGAVSGARENLSTIRENLKKIASARENLREDRRAEVKAATDQFVASVTSIAADLRSGMSLSEVKPRLTQAAQQLRSAYAGSLAKIDCS